MIEQIYKKIYFITGLLYNSNKDKELIMKQTEDDEYKKLSYEELNKLYDFLELFTSSIGLEYLPNYELSYLNKVDYLVIKRMQEKTFMYLNQYVEYDSNKSKKYGIKYDKNNLLVINNYEQALSEVYIKILNLISAKLLYFINKSNDITEDTKNKINKNYYFITPTIDSKIEDIIKNESNFYNNLWDDIKLEYDGFLRDFLMTEIAGVINVMLYDDATVEFLQGFWKGTHFGDTILVEFIDNNIKIFVNDKLSDDTKYIIDEGSIKEETNKEFSGISSLRKKNDILLTAYFLGDSYSTCDLLKQK